MQTVGRCKASSGGLGRRLAAILSGLGSGKADHEAGVHARRVIIEIAAMLLNYCASNAEAKPCSVTGVFGGEERFDEAFGDLGRDTASGICDAYFNVLVRLRGRNLDPTFLAGFDFIDGVADEIHQHLLDLNAVTFHRDVSWLQTKLDVIFSQSFRTELRDRAIDVA